ncbi:hypothetical protein [Tissierella sp. Yu-01]|uniref:hypothetical protein n=1 Tax=Tissierella sp. Yu-01 TaxID=3035694 RepID=UPI00240E8D31|nr:hypothetical protein [Tissierella sp. Yu-01]WFA08505.1 hypothetical protein P3962_12350 [Tissierella sp. Yu-01]
MAGVLGYTKKFIILKKDFCNMPGLNPKGHGKIEIKGLKGSLSISLENAEEEQIYNVLLVDKHNAYNLGKVYTEKNGKGREELDFNISDLESKGLSLESLNGILVARDTNILLGGYTGKEDGALEGYIKSLTVATPQKVEKVEKVKKEIEEPEIELQQVKDEPQIEDEPKVEEESNLEEVAQAIEPEIVQEVEIQEEPEVIAEPQVIEEPEPVFVYETEEFVPTPEVEAEAQEEPEEVMQEVIETIEVQEVENPEIEEEEIGVQQEEYIEEVIEVVDEVIEEVEELNFEEEILEVQAEDDFDPVFEPIADLSSEQEPVAIEPETQEEVINIKEFDYEYNRKVIQRNQTTNYVLSILRYFPYSDPFQVNLSGYNWWRIDYQEDDKGFLPYYSYVTEGKKNSGKANMVVTANELMAVHGHYIFGLYNVGDEVKYYVYGVPGGFYKDEHPHSGTTGFNTWFPGNEVSGYWLLYIDPLSGEVIYPINPMNPIE